MPVTGTPVTLPITIDEIRAVMRDYAGKVPNTGEENILLDDVQFSDDEIARAIRFTVHRYNLMTPQTRVTAEFLNPYLLLLGATAFLMGSESFRQVRNQATFQAGDAAGALDDKAQLYQAIRSQLSAEFESSARAVKTENNMNQAYGSISSGYPLVTRWSGR